jgi:hypothetical protein
VRVCSSKSPYGIRTYTATVVCLCGACDVPLLISCCGCGVLWCAAQDVVKQMQLNTRDPRAFIDQLNEAGGCVEVKQSAYRLNQKACSFKQQACGLKRKAAACGPEKGRLWHVQPGFAARRGEGNECQAAGMSMAGRQYQQLQPCTSTCDLTTRSARSSVCGCGACDELFWWLCDFVVCVSCCR